MDVTKADDGQQPVVQAARSTAGSDVDGEGARGTSQSDGTAANSNRPLPLDTPPEASGCADDVDDDDEQVERFYALLASIRAMRRVYTPGGGGGTRKRLWKPEFKLEDFEDDATATSRWARKKERSQLPDGGEEEGDGSVVTSPSRTEPPPVMTQQLK